MAESPGPDSRRRRWAPGALPWKPAGGGRSRRGVLAVILSRLVRDQIVLQKQATVEVVDFAAGLACFALVAVLATLSHQHRTV